MFKPLVEFKFTGKGTFEHKTAESIGADLTTQSGSESNRDWSNHHRAWRIRPGEMVMIPTGLYITKVRHPTLVVDGGLDGATVKANVFLSIRPRSSSTKRGLIIPTGTVDADYRGEVKVAVLNSTSDQILIRPGDRIAQIICSLGLQFAPVSNKVRGEGGFGSTGI